MRRRRQGLQVSTFPFLAVLLCAMGSLILLLLIIDRQAKRAGRAKALREAARATARAAAEEAAKAARDAAARKAEWERKRHALHELLLQQDTLLRSRIEKIEENTRSGLAAYQAGQERVRDLKRRIRSQQLRLLDG